MTIIVLEKNRTDVTKIANDALSFVCSWLGNHKVIVNTQKTKYMILSTKPDDFISINSSCIKILDNRR